jgi:Domain of unknown function (DUF4124)
MRKNMVMAFVLLAMSGTMAAGDDIYTWTDSSGTVHVSQTPRKGAKKFVPKEEQQEPVRTRDNAILFLGGVNDTRYYLDRESVQVFANDRNKYRFKLYVDDKMYACTAWAYPSGIMGLEPRVGIPDMVSRALRIGLIGK